MKGMKGKFLKKLKTIQAIDLSHESLEAHEFDVGDNQEETLSSTMKLNDTMEEKNLSDDQLVDFEEKCPPDGNDKVILYTTSLRGVRKTFEDCSAIKFLLESLKVSFCERDVSFHQEFREELWSVLGSRVVPPRLFIKGRYIGGAEEVVGVLHEQGKLRKLLEGIPLVQANSPCPGCANVRFSVCFNCNGSRKVLPNGDQTDHEELYYIRCPECNENGLVKCPICF
uniref:Glutaredoxin domain-containing protein n=1 Tax=Cannabis sativa TaxID=3483 RepID=A0A803QIE1_CANSA